VQVDRCCIQMVRQSTYTAADTLNTVRMVTLLTWIDLQVEFLHGSCVAYLQQAGNHHYKTWMLSRVLSLLHATHAVRCLIPPHAALSHHTT